FSPGATISFLPQNQPNPITFTVVRPFVPFTKSVVLQVRSSDLGPANVVLKIYDSRFIKDRSTRQPWSLELEKAAAAANPREWSVDEIWAAQRGTVQVPHDVSQEMWYYHHCIENHETECDAYRRLQDLQGSTIPLFFFSGSVLYPVERAFDTPAIVMEYVPDAITLDKIPLENLTPDLCETLLRTADTLPYHGVLHNDLNLNNVLFTPSDDPNRVIIIDFGEAVLREESDDDSDWKELTRMYGCLRFIRYLLVKQKGIS
ncbi:hypothetical protein BC629DRAFT_1247529, partial [Irpex lacteus]